MPKSVELLVDELNDMLRRKGEPVMTILWPAFYEMCGIARFRGPRADEIVAKAKAKYGLLIGYGSTVVLVAHDRNFSPSL